MKQILLFFLAIISFCSLNAISLFAQSDPVLQTKTDYRNEISSVKLQLAGNNTNTTFPNILSENNINKESGLYTSFYLSVPQPLEGYTDMGYGGNFSIGYIFLKNIAASIKISGVDLKEKDPKVAALKYDMDLKALIGMQAGLFEFKENGIFGNVNFGLGTGIYITNLGKNHTGLAYEVGSEFGFKATQTLGVQFGLGYSGFNANNKSYSYFPVSAGILLMY